MAAKRGTRNGILSLAIKDKAVLYAAYMSFVKNGTGAAAGSGCGLPCNGMGFLFIQAVGFADVPVMAAYLVMVAAIFVAINLLVDILYFVVDPRLRVDRTVSSGNGE